jgi:hypothetical protein
MPALLEFQRCFARALQDGAATTPGAEIWDAHGLAVYAATRLGTLTRALALTFPAVQRLVGADFFEAASQRFIREFPPASACLDDYGAALPEFLAAFEPVAELPYLPDVARLEWAVSRALHARDAQPLEVGRLAALDAASLATVRFVPHPSIGLLRLRAPADAIWRAVLAQDPAAMAALQLGAGPVYLLIERLARSLEVRRLTPAAWSLTQRLCAGEPWHRALEQMGPEVIAAEDIHALLADHLRSGRFVESFATSGEPCP